MLSEDPKELFDLLASIPGQNPRVRGYGGFGEWDIDRYFDGRLIDPNADDFITTEALFKSSITPSQHQPLPTQD